MTKMTREEIENKIIELRKEYDEKAARFRAGDWTVSEGDLERLSRRIANWEAMLD